MKCAEVRSTACPVFVINGILAVAFTWAVQGLAFALLCCVLIAPASLVIWVWLRRVSREAWMERPGWTGVNLDW